MTFSYENQVLRPAILLLLGAEPDVIVHVAPVEHLTSGTPRKRSAAELGKGCPDLLLSVRWVSQGRGVGYLPVRGAQWLCMELKAPPCPGEVAQVPVCLRCLSVGTTSPRCPLPCGGRRSMLPRWSAGSVRREQRETHEAWERGGRWCSVVRTPADARAALHEARRRLRAAGLEPVAVEGRS